MKSTAILILIFSTNLIFGQTNFILSNKNDDSNIYIDYFFSSLASVYKQYNFIYLKNQKEIDNINLKVNNNFNQIKYGADYLIFFKSFNYNYTLLTPTKTSYKIHTSIEADIQISNVKTGEVVFDKNLRSYVKSELFSSSPNDYLKHISMINIYKPILIEKFKLKFINVLKSTSINEIKILDAIKIKDKNELDYIILNIGSVDFIDKNIKLKISLKTEELVGNNRIERFEEVGKLDCIKIKPQTSYFRIKAKEEKINSILNNLSNCKITIIEEDD